MTDPSALSFVRVSGADAAVFLNGQFTQNTLDLAVGETRIGAFCSPKGRAIAVAYLHQSDTGFELWTTPDKLTPLVTGLRRYVMRARVQFDEPDAPLTSRIVGLADGRIELDLAASAYGADAIRAGVPSVHMATHEQFVPQMLNLDCLGGIDFAKGCYTGQEIVARTHNLGTIKRRMLGFECARAATLKPGDELRDSAGGKVGQIVAAAAHSMLAVVRLAALSNELVAGDQAVAVGAINELPYAVPEYAVLERS